MTISLKAQNKISLWIVVAANIAIYIAAVKHKALTTGNWSGVLTTLGDLAPIGVGIIIVGVLNGLLSADFKAVIVFLRWNNPLPGSEAFSKLADRDSRVDKDTLQRLYGPLPIDPAQQNRLWYKLYVPLSKELSVAQVHREYLFTRDYACLALLMVAVLGTGALIQIRPWWVAVLYIAVPFAQFIGAAIAARNHGRRLVTTVLALTCVQEKGPAK